MDIPLNLILQKATNAELDTLAHIIGSKTAEPKELERLLVNSGSTLFQKVFRRKPSYDQIVCNTAMLHGIEMAVNDGTRDVERKLVRQLYGKTETDPDGFRKLPPSEPLVDLAAKRDGRGFKKHIASGGTLAAARVSGVSSYRIAGIVARAVGTTAGIQLPATVLGPMATAVGVVTGPAGWVTLGAGCLHTFHKPNYNKIVAAIIWIHAIRNRINPCWEWHGYSASEIVRSTAKFAMPALVIGMLIYGFSGGHWFGYHDSRHEAVKAESRQ